MRRPETIERDELRELLGKCWMTHDAMWFANCLKECGIETANRINQAAVRSMAKIEVKRLMKVLDLASVGSWGELRVFLDAGVELIRCDFMKFEPSYPAENTYRWDMPACFAYDGIQKLGVIEGYQCGIFTRLEGWLDGLGLQYTSEPACNGCMMHTQGHCFREYTIRFPQG